MLRYLLRRLLLALITLLGICLITFALIHLAPGDPLESGGAGTLTPGARQGSEALRRAYFLDLPLFYNGQPRGLEARTSRLLGRLKATPGSGEEASEALERIIRCGTVCMPALSRALKEEAGPPGAARTGINIAMSQILMSHSALKGGDGGAPDLSMLSPQHLQGLAAKLGTDPAAGAALRGLGTAALPAVMTVLLEGEAGAARAAADVAGAITGLTLGTDPTMAGMEARLDSWSEWWFTNRRQYVAFSMAERVKGRLTETQFAKWLSRMLTLRFGVSTHDGRAVTVKLGEALPVTLLLSILALGLAYLVAVPLGVFAAIRRGTVAERLSTVMVFVLYALPSFWLAMLLILIFGGVGLLDWFPIYGLSTPGMEDATGWSWLVDRAHHLVLPVICLSYGSLAVISRYQRSAMLEVIHQDYIRTARAKGLSERAVIFRHALRNALLPTITLLGLQLPFLISGSVIIERIFNIPGMGLMTFQAFLNRDYPVIMAVSVLAACLTLLGLLLSDLAYALADPRISLEERT